MKKIVIFSCILCLLLTGCGSNLNSGTLNCTKIEYDEDGYKTCVLYADKIVESLKPENELVYFN